MNNLRLTDKDKASYLKVKKDLTKAFNKAGWDTKCDTPDFILAEIALEVLEKFVYFQTQIKGWHNINKEKKHG